MQPVDYPVDVSPRMVELARQIDHLPPNGDYIIRLRKTPRNWEISIERAEAVRVWRTER